MNTVFKFEKKFTYKQALLAAFIAITLPTITFANSEHNGDKFQHFERGGMPEHGEPPYLRGLDLTSEQEDQIFNLDYAQVPTMRDQYKQREQLIEELQATTHAEKFDDAKAQELADKAAKLEREKVLTIARHDAKVFAILTPEQRKKALEFKRDAHRFGHGFNQNDDRNDDRDDKNKHPTHFRSHERSIENHYIL